MTRTLERRLADYAKQLDLASGQPSTHLGVKQLPPRSPASAPLRGAWRRRAAAMVAVAATVIAATVAVRITADDGQRVDTDRAGTPTDSATRDLATAPGFFSTQGTADEAVEAYLRDRLDRPAAEINVERMDPAEAPAPPGVGYRWSFATAVPGSGGIVILRRGPNDWWDIIEARSTSVSIGSAAHENGQFTVPYAGRLGPQLRLILQDIGDNVLAEATCSEEPCVATEDVPEIPIVVRLQLSSDGLPITFAEFRVDPLAPGDFATTTIEPNTIDLRDLAGSTAVRILKDILGDSATVLSVETFEPFEGGPATGTVTLETGTGATVDVDVECATAAQQCTLLGLSSPGFTVSEGLGIPVATPAAGELTITRLRDFDPNDPIPPVGEVVDTVRVEAGHPINVDPTDASWLRMDLLTDDGRILRYLRPL